MVTQNILSRLSPSTLVWWEWLLNQKRISHSTLQEKAHHRSWRPERAWSMGLLSTISVHYYIHYEYYFRFNLTYPQGLWRVGRTHDQAAVHWAAWGAAAAAWKPYCTAHAWRLPPLCPKKFPGLVASQSAAAASPEISNLTRTAQSYYWGVLLSINYLRPSG